MKTLLVAIALLLGACSPLDLFKQMTDKPTIGVDAQIGDNEAKVDLGIGKIGSTSKTVIEDNENSEIRTNSGKYHLEAKDNLTVVVNETNPWILILAGVYIFGRPLFKWLIDKLLVKFRRNNDG